MTTVWLLLLLVVSSQSVDSQSSDDEVCDGEDVKLYDEEQLHEMQTDVKRLQTGKSQLNAQHILHQLFFLAKTISGCSSSITQGRI